MTSSALPLLLLVLSTANPEPPGHVAHPPGTELDPRHLEWTRLRYEAKKLFVSAESEVRLRAPRVDEVEGEWVAAPDGDELRASGERVVEVTIDSTMAGRQSRARIWVEPHRAVALGRHKARLGKKGYEKDYRFTASGTFLRRRAPSTPEEASGDADGWSKVEDFFYPRAQGFECAAISEPSAIFYLLATDPRIAEGTPAEICLYSDKRFLRVRVERVGTEEVEADYRELEGESTREVLGAVEAWHLSMRPESADDAEDFEFLGLEGDVEIYLDPRTRAPLRLDGKLSGFQVSVKLREIELGSIW